MKDFLRHVRTRKTPIGGTIVEVESALSAIRLGLAGAEKVRRGGALTENGDDNDEDGGDWIGHFV